MMALAALVLMTTVAAQAIDPSAVPATGTKPADFVPAGWRLEQQVHGSLTGAAAPDLVLVLGNGVTTERVLLVLTRNDDRGWRRAAIASKLLACSGCRSAPAVGVGRNVLTVSSGLLTFRFRYEPASKDFLMIGEELTDPGPASPGRVSTDYVLGTQAIEVRQLDTKRRRTIAIARFRRTVDTRRVRIEDVDWNADVEAWFQAAQQAIRDPDPQSARLLVPVRSRTEMVGVPRILLARFRLDLGDDFDGTLGDLATQLLARRVELADPKAASSDRVLPPDAEFYWLMGPRFWCGTLGCSHNLYYASLATGEGRALISASDPDIETLNADLDVLTRSANGLFDVDVLGVPLTFDGKRYVIDKR
jgi:hypothetical protein